MATDQEMRKLYNRIFTVDPFLWQKLRDRSVPIVKKNAEVGFQEESGTYEVPFLGNTYWVDPFNEAIRMGGEILPSAQNFQLHLILLSYLSGATARPLSGEMVSEKQLKNGTVFFKGPHVLNREPILARYGSDPEGLRNLGARFGARPLDFGDVSFLFFALPKIPVGFILYCQDDEFDARLVITFDRSIEYHLKLDVIWALVNEIANQMEGKGV